MESVFAQQHPRREGGISITDCSSNSHCQCWGQHSSLTGRSLGLSWLFQSFLFTWFCCPNSHCFGEHFQATWMFLVISLGVCLARTELSYPSVVKLGKLLPLNPVLSWGFSAWAGNFSQSVILERKCEHCLQLNSATAVIKKLSHYNYLFQ